MEHTITPHTPQAGALAQVRRRAVPRNTLRQLLGAAAGFCAAAFGAVYGGLYPFGAALTAGCPAALLPAVSAGVAFGTVLRGSRAENMAVVCAVAFCAAARRLWPKQPYCGLWVLGCSWGAVAGLLCMAGAMAPAQLFTAGAEALLAVGCGGVLLRWPAGQGGMGLALLGGAGAAVLAAVPGPFAGGAAVVYCGVVGLVLACRGDRKKAACAGVVLGTCLCAACPGLGFGAVGLAFGTVLAAAAAPGSRGRCAAVFLPGCLLGAACAVESRAALGFLLAALLAAGVFLLLPKAWVLNGGPVLADPAETAARPAISSAATRLNAVAESLSGIAETVDGVYRVLPRKSETFNWVVEQTHSELCFNCGRREECWQQQYNNTVDGLFALKPLLEQQGRVGVEELPGQLCRCIHPAALSGAVSRAYALYRSRREARVHAAALRTALTEQYGAVADALAALSGQLAEPGVPEPYKSGQVAALFASLGLPAQECAVTQDGIGRLRAAVTLPRAALSGGDLAALAAEVSSICHRPMTVPQKLTCRSMTTLIFTEKPLYQVQFGTAGHAAGEVSGDAVQQFCTGNAAHVILCDGMGTGKPAAVDGNLAAELTARLLKAGFTAETAARLVNVALALKGEEESCATLDLLTVDLYTGIAGVFKAGAAPGFVVQQGKVRRVGEASLPVGILGAVNGQSCKLHLSDGDWAVLVSDGVMVDGPGWVIQQLELSARSGDTPQALAQILVDTARLRAESTGRPDDITAAVLRLERVK